MRAMAAAVGVLLLTAACTPGSSGTSAASSPARTRVGSPSAPSPPAPTSVGSSTPAPSATSAPATSASPEADRGTMRLRVGGPQAATYHLTLSGPAIVVPGGGVALVWRGERGVSVGIGGETFTGSRRTSTTLTVTIQAGELFVTSSVGECAVRLDRATPREVAGSFRCNGLRTPRGLVGARATFSARP